MRNFRTAAVALATAATVSVAGISAASAAPGVAENETPQHTVSSALSSNGLDVPAVGADLNAGTEVKGTDLFGTDTDPQPAWAVEWANLTLVAGIATVVGAVIGAVNYLKYTGVLPY